MGALAKKNNQVHQEGIVVPFLSEARKPKKVVTGEHAIFNALLALKRENKGTEIGIRLNVRGELESKLLVDIQGRKYLEFVPDYGGEVTRVFASKDVRTTVLHAYPGADIGSHSSRDKFARLSRLAVELEIY